MTSRHWNADREQRDRVIKMIGEGTPVKTVVIDRGHKNGPEIHVVTSTAIVVIYNQRSGKMITKLVARPAQIARYYKENETVPANLLKLAKEHKRLNLNK